MDKYSAALQAMAKNRYDFEKGNTSLREYLAPSEQDIAIGEEMGMAGMGSINKVTSMASKEAQMLREMIEKRNKLSPEPKGKVIQVLDGDLGDIRAAQKDFAKKESKILEKEASDKFWSIRNELRDIEDKGGSLSPDQLKSYRQRIEDYYSHPKADQDPRANFLMKSTFEESLRRLNPENYKPKKSADLIRMETTTPPKEVLLQNKDQLAKEMNRSSRYGGGYEDYKSEYDALSRLIKEMKGKK